MKKSTKQLEQEKIADMEFGVIYTQQKDNLMQILEGIIEKNHINTTQNELIKEMIFNQLNFQQNQEELDQQGLLLDNLLEDCLWPFQFERSFLRQLSKSKDELSLMIMVYMILEGYFDKKFDTFETNLIEQVNPQLLTNFYIFKSMHLKMGILFEVGLRKYPVIEGYQKLRGFNIKHQITFIDLRHLNQKQYLLESLKEYQINILSDPYKQELPFIYHEQEFLQNMNKVGPQDAFLYDFHEECWGELQFNVKQEKLYRWIPCSLPNYGVNQNQFIQLEDGNYVTQKWLDIREQKKFYRIIQFQNSDQIQTYADFQSAVNIIDFLTSIDECNIKPTDQEKQVIQSEGNLMVIGRSGTGKTTCAILRLFSIYVLIRYKAQLYNQNINQLLKHSQIENQLIGLHCLFTTQNQKLVQQVQKKYKQLLRNLQQASIEQNLIINQNAQEDSNLQTNIENSRLKDMILNEMAQDLKKAGFEKEKDVYKFTEYLNNDFPLFLSIKKLLFLIDNCLDSPFFQQQRFQKQDNIGDQAGWDNDDGINNIKQEIYQKQNNNQKLNLLEQRAQKAFQYNLQDQTPILNIKEELQQENEIDEQKIRFRNIRIVEVNYEIFRNQFWPGIQTKLKQKRDQDSVVCLVWTQIYSYIKGSQYSHKYPGNYLPRDIYLKQLQNVLEPEKIFEIYSIFLQYEKWKDQRNYFDQIDLVNYIINCVDKNQYRSNPIHHTLIDEVQDLPHSTIKLIKKLTEQSLYCSGDTAQSISKGVGFRFSDIKPLLIEQEFEEEKSLEKDFSSHQLTVNFRSHNKILQLANSIVNLIEIYFPKTIDKLKKEISDLIGPTPFVIQSNKVTDLMKYLKAYQMINNQQLQKQQQNQQQIQQSSNIGFDKVVIVKDEESKNGLPDELKNNFVCLTVAECKGLEYNDVIIWNFFSDQTISLEQWSQLNKLEIEIHYEDNDVYQSKITSNINFNLGQNQNKQYKKEYFDVQVKKLKLPQGVDFDPFLNQSFCLELKQFYVVVTRAKQRIIMFDQDLIKRGPIINQLTRLGVVKILDGSLPLDLEGLQLCPELIQPQQDNTDAWMEQAFQLFENKLYEEALKCFRFAQNTEWQHKCSAYLLAQEGQAIKNQIATLTQKLNTQINDREKKQINEQIPNLKKESNKLFKRAADIFYSYDQIFQAAQCYFSSEDYESAYKLFLSKRLYLECADCTYRQRNYYLLSILLLKENYFDKALDCLDSLKLYNVMLVVVNKFKKYFSDNTYYSYLQKLVPQIIEQTWIRFKQATPNSTEYDDQFKKLSIDNDQDQLKHKHKDEDKQKFNEDFQEQYDMFVEGYKFPPKDDIQFINFILRLLKININNIIDSFQRSFINYDIQELQRQMQDSVLNDFKFKFIADALEQMKNYDLRDYIIEYNFRKGQKKEQQTKEYQEQEYKTQEYQKIISRIYQCSRFIKNQNQKQSEIKTHNPKDLMLHLLKYRIEQINVDVIISSLCVFGFHELSLEYMKMFKYEKDVNFVNPDNKKSDSYDNQIINFFNMQDNEKKQKQLKEQTEIQYLLKFQEFSKSKGLYGINLKQNDENPYYLQTKFTILIQSIKDFFQLFDMAGYFQADAFNGVQIIQQIENMKEVFKSDKSNITMELPQFFTLIKFLQFMCSLFKKNSQMNIQNQLFYAMCIIYKILVPSGQKYSIFKYYSAQYLWVENSSEILKESHKLSSYEQFECQDNYYLISANYVVKMISKHFKDILNKIVSKYCSSYRYPFQKMNYVPFEISTYTYICNQIYKDHQLSFSKCPYQKIISEEKQFAVFEICFKKQFQIQLQQSFNFTLNLSDLNEGQKQQIKYIYNILSIQYLMKAQGSDTQYKQIKYIRFAMQTNQLGGLSMLELLKQLLILQRHFGINKEYTKYLYEYSQFLVNIQGILSLSSIANFNNAYSYSIDKELEMFYQKDFKATKFIILFSIPFLQKDQTQRVKFYLTQEQISYLKYQYNNQISISLISHDDLINNFINYVNTILKQEFIDFDFIEQVCLNIRSRQLQDIILDQIKFSRCSSNITEKLYNIVHLQQRTQKNLCWHELQFQIIQQYKDKISYDQFLMIEISNDERLRITNSFKDQMIEVDKSYIQSPALALVIRSYHPAYITFLSIIFNSTFLESFIKIQQIRIKLLQFMFNYADDSLKFRSALMTLVDLYDLEKELLSSKIYKELDRKDNYNANLKDDQQTSLEQLSIKINALHNLIKEWEKRNIKYQQANNQIDKAFELDPQLIQRRKRQQFQIDSNNIQKNQQNS